MKQKNLPQSGQTGFTLVEMLVVLAIMILFSLVIVLDFNRQKVSRTVILAQNETVTNLRKVQAYMLNSKNIMPGVPARYYVVGFNRGESFFTVNAVALIGVNNDYYADLEVIDLPGEATIQDLTAAPTIPATGLNNFKLNDFIKKAIAVDSNGNENAPCDENENCNNNGGPQQSPPPPPNPYKCMQVIFSAPYGKMYIRTVDLGDENESCNGDIANIVIDPVQLAALSQAPQYIYFSGTPGSSSAKYIVLNPISGKITAN